VIKKEYRPEVTVGDIEEPGKPEATVAAAAKGDAASGDPAKPVQISAISLLPKISQVSAGAHPAESHARQRMRAQAYYLLMRERVRVLSSPHPAEMIAWYAENLRDHADFDTPANRYGYALALTLGGQAKQAFETLRKFGDADPENLVFQIALGNAELYMGARDAALQRYARIEKSFPNNRALALAHADALLANGDKASGKIAEELLRSQLARDDEDPDLQTTFAHACELAGDTVRAGEAHATAAYLNGRAEDALNQLKQIAKRGDLNYYQRTRVEALIAQMTPLVLDMRRHKIRPEDQGKLAATGLGSEARQGLSFCVADKCNGSNNAKSDPQASPNAWPGRLSPQWPSSKSQILSAPSSNGNNDPLQ
jgi:tetratricopeptide (TPR) repeat protein